MMSLAECFDGSVYSRSRIIKDKSYSSFILMTFTKKSNNLVMPAMVGGFGKIEVQMAICIYFTYFWKNSRYYYFKYINNRKKKDILDILVSEDTRDQIKNLRKHGPYLAGLIEGDGTFAIKDKDNIGKINTNNYNPHIIIAFKLSDQKVAEYLCNLTNCGTVYKYKDRNYVLWKITTIKDVYIIVSVINGYMRTPKYETLHRYARYFNNYIFGVADTNITSNSPYYKLKIEIFPLDNSPINSNR